MEFSHFLNMLFPNIGGKATQSEFVLTVTENIMEEQPGKDDNDCNNPLAKLEPDTLDRYFNGKKQLSKPNARAILGKRDKERFAEYLNTFSYDTVEAIGNAMVENGVETSDDIPASCAELFESILMKCADRADKKVVQQMHKDATNQLLISSESTEFDEGIELSARKLWIALEKFEQDYYEQDEPNEVVFKSLFAVLETTFGASKSVTEPIGQLKMFLDALTTTMSEWNKITSQFSYSTSVSGFLVELVRKKLTPAMCEYFLFSEKHLHTRHIDISQYETSSEQITAIFKQVAKDWQIEDFICDTINEASWSDMKNFIKVIESKIYGHYDKHEKKYEQITEFIELLGGRNFISVFKGFNLKSTDGSNVGNFLSDTENSIIVNQKALIDLYKEICSE